MNKLANQKHYNLPYQPKDFIYNNNLNWYQGNIVKYISRYMNKNGIEDLEKAEVYLEYLKEAYNMHSKMQIIDNHIIKDYCDKNNFNERIFDIFTCVFGGCLGWDGFKYASTKIKELKHLYLGNELSYCVRYVLNLSTTNSWSGQEYKFIIPKKVWYTKQELIDTYCISDFEEAVKELEKEGILIKEGLNEENEKEKIMKKINVEKTIENIDEKRKMIEHPVFKHEWEKNEKNEQWFILSKINVFPTCLDSWEFGFSKDGEFLEGELSKDEFLQYYGNCIVYKEEEGLNDTTN